MPDVPTQPPLGGAGWARFFWRQLTSMKTALVLLLLLAVAAIPGSLVPQRTADPNGVIRWRRDDPELFSLLDSLQMFDVYTSAWFSAIYILLFVSLVGCIIPRTSHHLKALTTPPPQTPKNLTRLEGYRTLPVAGDPDTVMNHVQAVLARHRYRTHRYGNSVAGETGYLRESANLVFHFALVGVLLGLAFGTGFKYSGQKVIIEGQSFTNQLASYDSFSAGTFVDETSLSPYALRLDQFDAVYAFDRVSGLPNALDFEAAMTVTDNGDTRDATLKVNQPLDISGTSVYLLGNGFAPWLTVTDPSGREVFSQPVVFLPQDVNLTSVGVAKIPDGLAEQVGMVGFFYPSAVLTASGALASVYPDPDQPIVTFNVFTGDLGLNEGIPRNVYDLDTDDMTLVAGRDADLPPLVLGLGQTQELPNGLGTVTFESLPRFISVDIHRDPTQLPVGIAAMFLMAGLVVSLFVVRRRVWVRFVDGEEGPGVELAGLARGDDPGLDKAVSDIAQALTQQPSLTVVS